MKTRVASLLALVVALSASALAAPSAAAAIDNAPYGFSVSVIRLTNTAGITRGTTLMTVNRLMGAAQRQLSPDVWVYFGYHPDVDSTSDHGCDTLIVTFSNGMVSDLRIVNLNATLIIAANLKIASAAGRVAKQ